MGDSPLVGWCLEVPTVSSFRPVIYKEVDEGSFLPDGPNGTSRHIRCEEIGTGSSDGLDDWQSGLSTRKYASQGSPHCCIVAGGEPSVYAAFRRYLIDVTDV